MNLDLNHLGVLAIAGMIGLGIKLLLNRLAGMERTLNHHGAKLVRIEVKLGIPENHNTYED